MKFSSRATRFKATLSKLLQFQMDRLCKLWFWSSGLRKLYFTDYDEQFFEVPEDWKS